MLNYFSKKLNGNRKGFTLIELIIIIAIIAILVLLATPWFQKYVIKARETQIQHNTRVVQDIVDEHIVKNDDKLPDGLDEVDPSDPVSEGIVYGPEGPVNNTEPGPYYNVTDMNEITKVKHNLPGKFIANSNGKVYYIHNKTSSPDTGAPSGPIDYGMDKGQPMTDDQIQTLLDEGWIPVAHPADFEKVLISKFLIGNDFVFADGTKWEGTYNVPTNPKFLQVDNLDMRSSALTEFFCNYDSELCPPPGVPYQLPTPYYESADGFTYNGDYRIIYAGGNSTMENEAYFKNPINAKFEKMLFYGYEQEPDIYGYIGSTIFAVNAKDCLFEDIWVENMHLEDKAAFFDIAGSGNVYNNVHFEGSLTAVNTGAVFGAFAETAYMIKNSTVHADLTSYSSKSMGGFSGYVALVENSAFVGNIKSIGTIGGIAGEGMLAIDCHANANIEGIFSIGKYDHSIGGIFGVNYQNGSNLSGPIFTQHPTAAAALGSSSSGSITSNGYNLGGIVGTIYDWHEVPKGSNIVLGSASTMTKTPDVDGGWLNRLVSQFPANGTYHIESCPIFWEETWSPEDRECGCPYYHVIDLEENYTVN